MVWDNDQMGWEVWRRGSDILCYISQPRSQINIAYRVKPSEDTNQRHNTHSDEIPQSPPPTIIGPLVSVWPGLTPGMALGTPNTHTMHSTQWPLLTCGWQPPPPTHTYSLHLPSWPGSRLTQGWYWWWPIHSHLFLYSHRIDTTHRNRCLHFYKSSPIPDNYFGLKQIISQQV